MALRLIRPKTYVEKNLSAELREIERSARNSRVSELNKYEKALIYKYSDDGFDQVNTELRKKKGKNETQFGLLLAQALEKLPNYEGLVYRGVFLTESELQKCKKASENNMEIIEYPFISTSKMRSIAMQFSGNVMFRIVSKTGKEIEEISKYGIDSQNEFEILFLPNTRFNILAVTKENDYTLVTMEEI